MKSLLLTVVLAFSMFVSRAQLIEVESVQPDSAYDNINVHRLTDDSLSTSFIIWVKKSVQPHFHKHHTEQLFVLEGSGNFRLGEETFEIEPGDFITIPKGTVHSVSVTSDIPLKVISIQSPQFLGSDRIFVGD